MTNLTNKYKDRTPEETVDIIKQFFLDRNCYIQIQTINNYNSLIYSCTLYLYYNNKIILTSNGKGTSFEFALASGCAEMYERFCAAPSGFLSLNPVFQKRFFIKDNSKKEITWQNYQDNIYHEQFFNNILPEKIENNFNKIKKYYFNDNLYGVQYTNLLDSNNFKYYNESILYKVLGSNGLAAGNTIEEALVQGISEIFERQVMKLFYRDQFNNNNIIYYYINNDILPNYIQKFIKKLEQDNFNVFVYDLSYNYNLPVALLLIQNIKTHKIYFNFGSAPIFSIAIERCFTEIFQGFNKLPQYNLLNIIPKSSNDLELMTFNKFLQSQNVIDILPQKLINNSRAIRYINNNYYINDKDINNKELLAHILHIANLNNIQLYYNNLSLHKDIFTVRIICENFSDIALNSLSSFYNNINNINKKNILFNIFINYLKVFSLLDNRDNIENININLIQIKNLLFSLNKDNYQENSKILMDIQKIFPNNVWHPYYCSPSNLFKDIYNQDYNLLFIKILLNNLNFNNNNFYNTDYYKNFIPWYIIYNYKINKMNKENVIQYLQFLGYNDINIENFQEIDLFYVLNKSFIIPIIELYSSIEYNNFIQCFQQQ